MWTVRPTRCSAASRSAVSEAAAAKFPPSEMNTSTASFSKALTVSTESSPCSRGALIPNSASNAFSIHSLGFSHTPIVRSPWTLEWPRTGHAPAPGLPKFPCRSSRLMISLRVLTECGCCVRPSAHGGLGLDHHLGDRGDLQPGQPGGCLGLLPVNALAGSPVRLDAVGVGVDEFLVDD